MMTTTLGISGLSGSFSEEAGLLYIKRAGITPSFVYLVDMEGVLAAIASREIDFGILPVVNLQGGLVKAAFAAMGKYSFTLVDEFWLEVKQCLLTLPETKLELISSIVSYPQALAQCKRYLAKEFKGIVCVEWSDTAKAALDLSVGNLPTTAAVIASERCAQAYGLKVVAKNIQDSNPNLTAFIVVKPTKEI